MTVGMFSGSYVKGAVKAIRSESGNYMEMSQSLERIAVVNLDAGVEKNGEQIYYAGKIIEYPNSNYQTTSLEEAKKGLENGQYGAYVIIPSTFSASVDSINQTPQKTVFEYKISEELNEEEREDMIYEIADFEKTTSSNLSYIYVDAILKEIHSVQDGASTIMGNDSAEKEALLSVQPENLIEPVEFTELRENNEIVKPVDLSAENSNLDKSVRSLEKDFNNALDDGQKDYQKVVENNKNLEKALAGLEKSIEKTDPFLDTSGNCNYTAGLVKVNQVIDEKNTLITDKRDLLKDSLTAEVISYKDNQTNKLAQQRNTIQNDLKQSVLSDMQTSVNSQLQSINESNANSISTQNLAIQEELGTYQEELQNAVNKQLDIYQKESIEAYNEAAEEENQKIQELKEAAQELEDTDEDNLMYPLKLNNLLRKIEALEEKEAITMPAELEDLEVPLTERYEGELMADMTRLRENLTLENAKKEDGNSLELPAVDVSIPNASITLQVSDITYQMPSLVLENPAVQQTRLEEIENYYKVSKDGLERTFEKNVVEVVEKRNREIQADVFQNINEFSKEQREYQYGLDSFDPYSYMDYTDISNQLMKISDAISDMETDMNDRNEEYLNYTADVYELANEHTRILQEDMLRANEKTGQNIINQIDVLKNSRIDKNKTNVSILQGITQKLTFTRMGDLPYREAYDFIVNPLEYQRVDK